MTSTVRAYKGLTTKRIDNVLNWLRESSKLLDPVAPDLRQGQAQKIELAIELCDENISLMESSLTKLTEAFDRIEDTDNEEEEQLDKYLESAQETIMKLHVHKTSLKQVMHEIGQQSGSNHASSLATSKLPVIPIPVFSGKKWEWDNFWALFRASVHDQELTELQKFNYLLSSLTGEAKQSVSRFFVSAENYEKAIQLLVDRYGNKEGIVMELNKQLQTCNARGPSTMDQKQLFDKLSAIAAQLTEHGEHLDNHLTIQTFLQKFHVRIRRAAMEKNLCHQEEGNWTLDRWLKAIDEVLTQEEKIAEVLALSTQAPPKKNFIFNNACECCGKKGHRWVICPTIPTAEDKRNFLVASKRCLNCGSNNHRISTCNSGTCRKCGGQHHTAICTKVKASYEPRFEGTSLHKEARNSGKEQYRSDTNPLQREGKTFGNESASKKFEKKDKTPQKSIKSSKLHAVTMKNQEEQEPDTPAVLQLQRDETPERMSHSKVILLAGSAEVVSSEGETKTVTVLLDTGSELSFIEKSLADELKLPTHRTTSLQISTFGSPKPVRKTCGLTSLKLKDKEGTLHNIHLYKNDFITGAIQRASLNQRDLHYIETRQIPLSLPLEGEEVQPRILLGCDHLWNFVTPAVKMRLPSGLQLISTKGYIVSGRQTTQEAQRPSILCTIQGYDEEKETWDRYWSLESSGTEEYPGSHKTEIKKLNEEVHKKFKESIEKRADGYYVRLPWKESHPQLPDNKALALKRLKKVLDNYAEDPDTLQMYDNVFKDQLEKGVIEEVAPDEDSEAHVIHYLPHQAVITPMKETTKMRIVFDASAHYKNCPCLNDVLHQGPLILPDLLGILLRFRMHKIAVISDIEKAFLQVRLQEADRDATRCIWIRDINQPPTHDNLVVYRFTRVTFGLNASPFLLSATIDFHLECTAPDDALAPEIRQNLYVDNLLFGARSSEEALQKYIRSKEIFQGLNMNLREFMSNDERFNSTVKECDRMKTTQPKVLGISWNPSTDKIIIKGTMAPAKGKTTKRTVTHQLASVYDPLGLLVPLLLPAKVFLQSLWKEGIDWDTPLALQWHEQWRQLSEDISTFYKEIDRNTIMAEKATRIFVFVDASQFAIASCAYLAWEKQSQLLMAKSKLPSLKTSMTIPKLEMNALTLGTRMALFLHNALQPLCKIEEIILFTDSEIVLGWIKSSPSRQSVGVLVANRLQEIGRIVNDLEEQHVHCLFGHVHTAENPADCATRGLNSTALQDSLWWQGPNWMHEHDSTKLTPFNSVKSVSEVVMTTSQVTTRTKAPNASLLDLNRFHSLHKAQRVMVYVLRYVKRAISHLPELRKKQIYQNIQSLNEISTLHELAGAEMHEARIAIIKAHQKEFVNDDRIKSQKDLNIHKDERGVLRCYGRLQEADIVNTAKNPIFIAPNTVLARLIISEAHDYYHKGLAHTMAAVREKYWIPKLRRQTQVVIRRCVPCQKINNLPFTYPETKAVPSTRVRRSRPFQHIGLDYFGPLMVKNTQEARKQNMESNEEKENKELKRNEETQKRLKAYGCILTCQTTRLIHLELVEDMSTEAFINALRRFFARRGVPETITCDNAPTFLLGEQILHDAINNAENSTNLQSDLAQREIRWKHITPYAPWQGGFYERLIRTIKDSLHKTLGVRIVTFDALRTILAEIEAVLNSRPLTYQEEKWEDQPILRPIDFLQNDIILDFPLQYIGENGKDRTYHTPDEAQQMATQHQAEEALRSSVNLTEKFWKIWSTQYLTNLREYHRVHIDEKRGTNTKPKEGDVVLMWESLQPRNTWKMARIIEFQNAPGAGREAVLETPNKHKLRRPINRIVPLELGQNQEETSSMQRETSSPQRETSNPHEDLSQTRYNLRPRKKVDYNERKDEGTNLSCLPSFFRHNAHLLTVLLLTICAQVCLGSKNITRHLQCIEGGVILTQGEPHQYEICAEDYCIEFRQPQRIETVRFPAQITLHEHLVKWKTFDGHEVNIMETTCKAAQFCEQLTCTFCTAMMTNPECWPRTAILVTGVAAYAAISICYCVFHVPVLIGAPLLYLLKIVGLCARILIKALWNTILVPAQRRRRRISFSRGAILMALTVSTILQACQDVDVFTHQSRSCYRSKRGQHWPTLNIPHLITQLFQIMEDNFTEEERRFMQEKLRQEFARKIRMVESSPARPTISIVQQKLKFHADKCYEFENLHKHAKARFVSLMMDKFDRFNARGGALHYLLKIKQLYMEHKEERTNLTIMRDQFVLVHEWYEVLVAVNEANELERLAYINEISAEVFVEATEPGDEGYPEPRQVRRNYTKDRVCSVVQHLLGLYDLLLHEEKAAVENAECDFQRNTALEDKTLSEMRNAFVDLQEDMKRQQHETREWMQSMHQHFEGLVTREMKDGFHSIREDVKRRQESTMHQIEDITAQLKNLSDQVSEEAESQKHEFKSQSKHIRSWLDKMESSISSISSTRSHSEEPDKHTHHDSTRQHRAQQGEEDRASRSGGTRTGSKRRHESSVSESDRQEANLQKLLDQSERELSEVEHFLSNCGGIERRFGDREMKDNESLLMCVYCKVFGKHYSDACPRIRSVAERLEILREEGRCLYCIELHDALSCRKRPICFYCKRADPSAPPSKHHEHHASICTKSPKSTSGRFSYGRISSEGSTDVRRNSWTCGDETYQHEHKKRNGHRIISHDQLHLKAPQTSTAEAGVY